MILLKFFVIVCVGSERLI